MRLPAAALAAAALAFASPAAAAGFSGDDAAELSAAVKNGRMAGTQKTVDLLMRLGRERDMGALDHLIALRQAEMAMVYANAFRSPRPSPGLEKRLVAIYDEPRLAVALLTALERYESPELAEKLLGDVAALARTRVERARECRIIRYEIPQQDPRFGGSVGSLGVKAAREAVRADCPPRLASDVLMPRREQALRIVGATALPGVVEAAVPLLPDLAQTPPVDESARALAATGPTRSALRSLSSIAGLAGERRYAPAAPALVALLSKLQGAEPEDFDVALPFLKALGPMDLREGTQTIARWVERRSAAHYPEDRSPSLWEMVSLLGPILPPGHVDLSPTRDAVLANLGASRTAEVIKATFASVQSGHAGLRNPGPGELVRWARGGHKRVVGYLIGRGVAVDSRDAEGETALVAAIPLHFEIQKMLVAAGANPELPGRDGSTPFHLAVAHFQPRDEDAFGLMEYYRRLGADVNRQSGGRAPMHTAAAKSLELVSYLAANGARIDERTKERVTPLHVAVLQRKPGIAEFLLKHGANPNAEVADQFGDGLRPLQMARDADDRETEALLMRHGATTNPVYAANRGARKVAGTVLGVLLLPWISGH